MSIQGSMLGAVGAIAYGIKGLKERHAEANKKATETREAQKEQQQRFRKSPILNKLGENIMVPTQQLQQNDTKIQLLDAKGGKL